MRSGSATLTEGDEDMRNQLNCLPEATLERGTGENADQLKTLSTTANP